MSAVLARPAMEAKYRNARLPTATPFSPEPLLTVGVQDDGLTGAGCGPAEQCVGRVDHENDVVPSSSGSDRAQCAVRQGAEFLGLRWTAGSAYAPLGTRARPARRRGGSRWSPRVLGARVRATGPSGTSRIRCRWRGYLCCRRRQCSSAVPSREPPRFTLIVSMTRSRSLSAALAGPASTDHLPIESSVCPDPEPSTHQSPQSHICPGGGQGRHDGQSHHA